MIIRNGPSNVNENGISEFHHKLLGSAKSEIINSVEKIIDTSINTKKCKKIIIYTSPAVRCVETALIIREYINDSDVIMNENDYNVCDDEHYEISICTGLFRTSMGEADIFSGYFTNPLSLNKQSRARHFKVNKSTNFRYIPDYYTNYYPDSISLNDSYKINHDVSVKTVNQEILSHPINSVNRSLNSIKNIIKHSKKNEITPIIVTHGINMAIYDASKNKKFKINPEYLGPKNYSKIITL